MSLPINFWQNYSVVLPIFTLNFPLRPAPSFLRQGLFLIIIGGFLHGGPARARENYEIQVYPCETVEPPHTMVEFHTNFTFSGPLTSEDAWLRSMRVFNLQIGLGA